MRAGENEFKGSSHHISRIKKPKEDCFLLQVVVPDSFLLKWSGEASLVAELEARLFHGDQRTSGQTMQQTFIISIVVLVTMKGMLMREI